MLNEATLLNEEECYLRLKEDICRGILMPNQHLVELDLAKSYGAGRAAIRTALARLEQEGLVERERYRGARVRLVTEEEAIEILEVRTALEGLAARRAAENATDEDEGVLQDILHEMKIYYEANDLLKYSDCNTRLHHMLIKMSGNKTAAKVLDTLNSQSVRFQYKTILQRGRPDKSYEDHRAIVEAVIRRDPDAAEQAMRLHLGRILNGLRDLF
ncbi:GntR family transcriptional regulator [Paenibacillus naphthalenovorans]|uniref:GntR family transcriptional regulator n=1 Tax=Paenibacillus naphthalenovorans TaxID=162209 RepID=UPI00087FFEDA|nr:GntR family transcriptional regulator [Paenibacillus naphthalenovorans]SDJ01642.1 DNA-binding transcriptional regulator, GntR family [Paenibacillus naphthalenovorans]